MTVYNTLLGLSIHLEHMVKTAYMYDAYLL